MITADRDRRVGPGSRVGSVHSVKVILGVHDLSDGGHADVLSISPSNMHVTALGCKIRSALGLVDDELRVDRGAVLVLVDERVVQRDADLSQRRQTGGQRESNKGAAPEERNCTHGDPPPSKSSQPRRGLIPVAPSKRC